MTKPAFRVLALVLAVGACERTPRLETRTFALSHLEPAEAAELVDPYIFRDRERSPGTISAIPGAVTVRETEDNLARIEATLLEFDRPRPDVRLHFRLLRAERAPGPTDERIADVVEKLQEIFPYAGYTLVGDAVATAADGAELQQVLSSADRVYWVGGRVYRTGPDVVRLEQVQLQAREAGTLLSTTVNIRPGQTLVLGSSAGSEDGRPLLLTVRADAEGGG